MAGSTDFIADAAEILAQGGESFLIVVGRGDGTAFGYVDTKLANADDLMDLLTDPHELNASGEPRPLEKL